jgi:ATP-dependent protease Clp ATPase subunit
VERSDTHQLLRRDMMADVLQMIAGVEAFICNECVQLSVSIIATRNPDWLDQFLTTPPAKSEG